jgi:uncharacterized protein with PIN domain
MNHVRFHFEVQFDIFLSPEKRGGEFDYAFTGNPSLKHLIEAMRVPHTEIGEVKINGEWKSLAEWTQDGDIIKIYPITNGITGTAISHPREADNNPLRFILDNHLGKLASYLRMLGFDALYRNDFQDDELAELAIQQERILLTRDRGLLMRRAIVSGCLIRSMLPEEQVVEVLQRYQLSDQGQPFQRCLRCNDLLLPVDKAFILDRLEPLTRRYFDEFRQCQGCQQIYWKGSHYERMLNLIDEFKSKTRG